MPINAPILDDEEYDQADTAGQDFATPAGPILSPTIAQPPAPDPSQGPAGFPSFMAYQQAFDQARRTALQDQQEQLDMQRMLRQSAQVEDQIKAIQSYKQFIGARRLGRAVQEGVARGLPAEQALALGAIHNLDAFKSPASAVPILTAAAKSRVKAPDLGAGTPLVDPRTGKPIGVGFRTSQGGITAHFDPSEAMPGGANVSAILGQIRVLQQRRILAADDPDQTKASTIDKQIDDALQELTDLRRGGARVPASVPAAAPAGASASDVGGTVRLRDNKTGRVFSTPAANAAQAPKDRYTVLP